MGLYRSLSGIVVAEMVSADIPGCMQILQNYGIEIWLLEYKSVLSVQFQIRYWDYCKLRSLLKRRGANIRILQHPGLLWRLLPLYRRPVLILGLFTIILLSCCLPSRILFIRVEGNTSIPDRWILEQAANCGLAPGASSRAVRSEAVKNQLLSKVEGLQWAGVNTYGCVAVIQVRERGIAPTEKESQPLSGLYAKRDGVIISIVAKKGRAVCKVSDAVKAGQLLISGYTDCGRYISATGAVGEVMGLTDHGITVISPLKCDQRGEKQTTIRQYSLIVGKKRIKLSKDSGIFDITCARIYSQWYMTLPGGFVLPLGIICEEYTTYAQAEKEIVSPDLSSFARDYILSSMTDGKILSAAETYDTQDDFAVFHGRYACCESLGITKTEENLGAYGKDP